MAKEQMMTGCRAAAEGAKAAEVEVICSYPIRPYTAIMMELAKMVANGELNAEFVHGEGEHAQVSVVLGACCLRRPRLYGKFRGRGHLCDGGVQPDGRRPVPRADVDRRPDARSPRRFRLRTHRRHVDPRSGMASGMGLLSPGGL